MSTTCPPPLYRRVLVHADLITAGVIALLAGLTLAGQSTPHVSAQFALDVAVLLASVAAAPLLTRRLGIGAGVLTGLALLSPVGTPGATIAVLHAGWRTRPRTAVTIALAGIATHLLRWIWTPYPGLSFKWWVILVVAVYAALLGWGTHARSRQRLLISLAERAHRAETEQEQRIADARTRERTLIAREMHDVLAHHLSLLATYAGALEYRKDSSAEQVAHAAGVIRAGAHQALEELREVIGVLRTDPGEDDAGTGTRPQPTLADLPALVQECTRSGMRVTVTDTTTEAPPSTIARTAYRIVQEGLTNARKHAPGAPVEVQLTGDPSHGLRLRLRNPVVPGDAAHLPGAGTGLAGLTERVRLVDGDLNAGVGDDDHFELRARLPWGR